MLFPPNPFLRRSTPIFLTLWVGISCVSCSESYSSGILFSENFENLPTQQVKSIFGRDTAVLGSGPSPCGKFTTGVAADFKSQHVDFQSSQNPSHFVAMNPESPCGGAYGATIALSPLNFSKWESVEFKARYFRESAPTWGTEFEIMFSVPGDSFTVDTTALPSIGKWDSFSIKLPPSMLKSEVKISITSVLRMGLDDIQIVGIGNGPVSNRISSRTRSAPTLQSVKIFDLLGKSIEGKQDLPSRTWASSKTRQAGAFLVRTEISSGEIGSEKIILP